MAHALNSIHFKKPVARISFLSKSKQKVPQFWKKRDTRNWLLKMSGLYMLHACCYLGLCRGNMRRNTPICTYNENITIFFCCLHIFSTHFRVLLVLPVEVPHEEGLFRSHFLHPKGQPQEGRHVRKLDSHLARGQYTRWEWRIFLDCAVLASADIICLLSSIIFYTKVLFIFRCSKNWQKKKCAPSFVSKWWCTLFFANFYCSKRWKVL